jgi:transposase InsO family protein
MWTAPDVRDSVIDFITQWSSTSGIGVRRFLVWLGLSQKRYYSWKERYGKTNEHNSWIPRDHWLEEWEKEAIVGYYVEHSEGGYRRLTYMMLDADIVAVSATTVWRVLSLEGLLRKWEKKANKKGQGFVQPDYPHKHWHIDVSYVNIRGTFYYLCSVLDGYSRFIVHWDIRESMTEAEIEIILQAAREKFPEAKPRIISDNGPQFLAKDFKEFIRIAGMTHVRTSPYYPQSNGKIERCHKSIKQESIRPMTPLTLEDARRVIANYIEHYNNTRLHSAVGYVAPLDKLEGRDCAIFEVRDHKLKTARELRQRKRFAARTGGELMLH